MSQTPYPNFAGMNSDQIAEEIYRMSTDTTAWSPNTLDRKSRKVIEQLPAMANSDLLSDEQKLEILSRCSHSVLDDTYNRHVALFGLPQVPAGMILESHEPDVVGQGAFFGLPQVPAAITAEGHRPDVVGQGAFFGMPQPSVPAAITAASHEPDVFEQGTFFGLPQPPVPAAITAASHEPDVLEQAADVLDQDTYVPVIDIREPTRDPNAAPPIYPPYASRFITSEQARLHRKRVRLPPKSDATDIDRVKRYGRKYWVRRLYEAMIDISSLDDGESSVHRTRFAKSMTFDPADMEATAHHIFDSVLAVHERGWNRPQVYHKKVKRGKLSDLSEKSVEQRLKRICEILRDRKATVDDAMRGGVTLALLCDNPEARAFTKLSNNAGNKKRGERLKREKEQQAQQQGDDVDE